MYTKLLVLGIVGGIASSMLITVSPVLSGVILAFSVVPFVVYQIGQDEYQDW